MSAFASYFTLDPRDFGFNERDYFVLGLKYLLPDPRIGANSFADKLIQLPWLMWFVVAALAAVLLFNEQTILRRANRRNAGYTQSVILMILAPVLYVSAADEGRSRAQRANDDITSLPLMTVAYKMDECTEGMAYLRGRLLLRTDTVVCVKNVINLYSCGRYLENFKDSLLIIPTSKVTYIDLFYPEGGTYPEMRLEEVEK